MIKIKFLIIDDYTLLFAAMECSIIIMPTSLSTNSNGHKPCQLNVLYKYYYFVDGKMHIPSLLLTVFVGMNLWSHVF